MSCITFQCATSHNSVDKISCPFDRVRYLHHMQKEHEKAPMPEIPQEGMEFRGLNILHSTNFYPLVIVCSYSYTYIISY